MTLNPSELTHDLDLLEQIEKATLRLVSQALFDFAAEAVEIFALEQDRAKSIGEDITREALDKLGTSTLAVRLAGDIDYKRARYIFHPEFALRQALFVDSKTEKVQSQNVIRIQTTQTSMAIRQYRVGRALEVKGELPTIYNRAGIPLLTTTVFVKYNYVEEPGPVYELIKISLTCLPNGMLQERYNPSYDNGIWNAGPNAPSRGEKFRTRINVSKLKRKAAWRVQSVLIQPSPSFTWED